MKGSGTLVVNVLTVLSLMLFSAAAVIWVDHQIFTDPGIIIRPTMQLEMSLSDVTPGLSTGVLRTVDLSGRIDLPILGKLQAAGLTCAQLSTNINNAFSAMGVTKTVNMDVRIVGFPPPNGLVMSLLLAIPAARVLIYFGSSWKARWRLRAGLCRHCGYDLRASPDRCPECGAAAAVPSSGTPGEG